ncbi:DUF885 domain-containing protein [Gilvimarinus sp. SDUM040013]|uniref:DUF885 domain-containing protein n=1 Tax=Gilvimarinus gilvus TaxID=3058038 RepID=A0ABU4S126_9GAMM|nr:DUF885 domain-containing protein [Gilvimarinus sp. SDUM040013]MDO3388638.1 DUF885 domain-containing protein [Gilvimarinus sp. SDUM040013]MDX6849533.1 DUF885 domain-containing protein [Gilvimarinus sp. SDUM040013]
MTIWKLLTLSVCLTAMHLNVSANDSLNNSDDAAEKLFDDIFEQWVSLSPMMQTRLGRTSDKGLWDDISPAADRRAHKLYQAQLQQVESLEMDTLSAANKLNRQLLINQLSDSIAGYRWREHSYPVNQMFGWHSSIPAFLINAHNVNTEADIQAYISRLQGVSELIAQVIENLEVRAQKGILAPQFVYSQVLQDCRNLISGVPFSTSGVDPSLASIDSPLWSDFTSKLNKLELTDSKQQKYLDEARIALRKSLQPAYRNLINTLQKLEQQADNRAGVWKFPAGDDFYRDQLRSITTTELSAEDIHNIGLQAVARIHEEMRALQKSIGFEGNLQEFFTHLKTSPEQYYPDTQQGRAAYLSDTRSIIDQIEHLLPQIFGRLPKAELTVKAVEPFREKSAGKAFYQAPAEDGSRPGIYYLNLHDLAAMPKYQMRALAYHEALPGHHMQIAIAQELENMPAFRRHSHYTAYIEGWGLYAEQAAKELGLYQDPYADFGRLSFELWRAIRLVVDTGIHHYRWTRKQSIEYFVANSPMPRADATREVERYIVLPGQATSYMIGMLKIQALMQQSKNALKTDFSLREFHDQILDSGALPLNILEQKIDSWVNSKSLTP